MWTSQCVDAEFQITVAFYTFVLQVIFSVTPVSVSSMFTAHKMKFSIKDFFSKCDQIRSFLRIWSHLLKKSSMENFIFCVVVVLLKSSIFNKKYFKKVLT